MRWNDVRFDSRRIWMASLILVVDKRTKSLDREIRGIISIFKMEYEEEQYAVRSDMSGDSKRIRIASLMIAR